MNVFYSRKLIVHVVTKMIYINIQICVYAPIYWNRNCLPFRGTLVQPLVSGAARWALSLMCCLFIFLFFFRPLNSSSVGFVFRFLCVLFCISLLVPLSFLSFGNEFLLRVTPFVTPQVSSHFL